MKLKANQPVPRDRIIVALDVPDRERALQLVRQLREFVGMFKVGLQLYIAEGPEIVKAIRAEGVAVFLDLKLHDIPNTVERAVESAAKLGASMLTLHLAGGDEMIRAAVKAAPPDLLLLGVTVLTSSSEKTLSQTGIAGAVDDQVLRLARLGRASGVRGFVASAQELPSLRRELGDEAQLVIPGIRLSGGDTGDQKRVMTPGNAIRAGANFLVIGRPITAAVDPRAVCREISAEIAALS